MPLTFPKAEKLCGKRDIAELIAHGFRGGTACLRYCCRITPLEQEEDEVRIAVSVPKKCFKRAVKRNVLKRRIREAFRLQKSLLLDGQSRRYDILFTYIAPDILPYEDIRAAVAAILSGIRRQGTGS